MSATLEERKATNKALIDEVLKAYPEKMAKRRAKHLNTFEENKPDCGVKSNIKSLPGVMTIRGCAYAGSKGVVWGPIKDMVHISHGPVGCGQYSWGARRPNWRTSECPWRCCWPRTWPSFRPTSRCRFPAPCFHE